MKLAVISDLHLSTPGPSCAFTHSTQDFLALLDFIERDHEIILLGGDIFDHDVGERIYDRASELRAAKLAWAPIVERLQQPHCRWIHGNHDTLLAEDGVPSSRRMHFDGLTLELHHGHLFGRISPMLEPIKYPIKWIAGRSQRKGGRLGDLLYKINDTLSEAPDDPNRHSSTGRGALKRLKANPELDLVICGHDHIPRVDVTPKGTYANSGTCGYGRMDWLSIDTASKSVTIHNGTT